MLNINFLLQPKTPSTPQVEATGSKTLFMGNLSFSIEQADVYVYIFVLEFYHKMLV